MERLKSRISERWKSIKGKYCIFWLKFYRIHCMAKAEIKKNTWVAWSEDEIKLLKKLFLSGGAREIAKQIGRPLTAVKQKAYSMGIRTRAHRLWSANEMELLKTLYQDENVQGIAAKLGRPKQAVTHKAYRIGITKEKYPPWSNHDISLLKKMYPDNSPQDIASFCCGRQKK